MISIAYKNGYLMLERDNAYGLAWEKGRGYMLVLHHSIISTGYRYAFAHPVKAIRSNIRFLLNRVPKIPA